MILALTEKSIVDLVGVEARMESEKDQGVEWDLFGIRGKFKDLGLVYYRGIPYYATLYTPVPFMEDK